MKKRAARLVSILCALALIVGLAPLSARAAGDTYVQNFTTDGKSSTFYTITGNLSTSKGTVTYNGLTLTQCLKMESSTSIAFTAPSEGTLTLVFVESAGTAKIDGTKHTATDGVIAVDLAAGAHTVTKADTANLFYMSFGSSCDHAAATSVVTKAATCSAKGIRTYTCTCGATWTEEIDIDPEAHSYPSGSNICEYCDWDKSTSSTHAHQWTETARQEATCGEDGYVTKKCSSCQKEETEPLSATGQHEWGNDGVCTVCGAEKPTGSFTKVGGGFETAYAQWSLLPNVTSYKVYVKAAGAADTAYEQIDDELIRQYPTYMRADAVGLAAGSYVLKVEGLMGGTVQAAMTTGTITVRAHDRSGFAFVNGTSSGAYNENGTLKSDAVVVYITPETKDKLSLTVTTSNKGATTDCTSLQDILNAFKKGCDFRPLCVRLIGNITDFAVMDKGDIVVDGCANGVTVEGIGNDAVANGWGLRIKGSTNVEVRNLGFMNCNSGEGDCLGLQQNNDHIWAHNNDFFYGDAGSDADQAKGDGSLDTKTSTYVTHSYNHFWDSGKCNLQGMKSESTSNYITYHHNWYDHSDSRHPRIRTCTVHIYNNYFDGNAKYGVGMTMGGSAFVENNYFRNVTKPMLISGQGTDAQGEGTFSGETGGVIKSYNNKMVMENRTLTYLTQKDSATSFDAYEVSARNETVPSSVKALSGGTTYNNFDTDASLMYDYTPDTPDQAMVNVQNYAGRLEGGDFQWPFNNATEDADYGVNAALKSALTNYKPTLVSVGGTVTGTIPTSPVEPTACAHANQRSTVTLAATCVDAGTRVTTCQDCGATIQTETIPATGQHTYVGGVCTVCQAVQAEQPDDPTPGTASVYVLTGDEVFSKLTPNGKDSNTTPRDLYNFASGEKLENQGTDGFFTIYGGPTSDTGGVTKIDYSSKSFSDGYSGTYRINFNNPAAVTDGVPTDVIGFTTAGPATVKIYWVQGGGTNADTDPRREVVILDSQGVQVATTTKGADVDKNAVVAVETLSLQKAGTYYVGGAPKKNPIFKVEVAVTPVEQTTPDVAESGWLRGSERDLKWYYTEAERLTVEQMEAGDSVLVGCYDALGRFTGLKELTPDAVTVELSSTIPTVKLFWVNTAHKPMCEAATAWGGAQE